MSTKQEPREAGMRPAANAAGRRQHGGALASGERRVSADECAAHLRCRVQALAGDIGERNVRRPAALAAAAGYIRVMLSLEMLGCNSDTPRSQAYPPFLRWFHPDRGNFIAFVSNLSSRPRLREVVAAFRANSDFPSEQLASPALVRGLLSRCGIAELGKWR